MKPIIEEYRIDLTPFQIYRHFSELPHTFLLDSGMDPDKLGRFSFLGIEPFLIFISKGNRVDVNLQGWKKSFTGNPFYVLRELLKKYSSDFRTEEIPFWGGAVGYFSYDLKDFIEKLPDIAVDDLNVPDCQIGFYDCVLICDHLKNKTYLSSSGFPESGEKRVLRARARLDSFKNELEHINKQNGTQPGDAVMISSDVDLKSNFTKEEYLKRILKAKEYISKGDIYQVNLSQRFSADCEIPPFNIYSILRSINPAPFGAYLNFGDVQIASASPERFIKVENGNIQTRPIKGTRPRGRNGYMDRVLRQELSASVKDRAENLMIVDLERNDLGRICDYGSVRVSEFMICEEFPTVFHLTSTIEGKLKAGVDAVDVLLNCFPGGSITGAPKIRSMEIIEELENVKRSIYTGAVGYIGFNGDMDTSIVIRTFISKKNKLYFNVGGGIVYDSVPENEYDETLHKARALMDAIGYRQISSGRDTLFAGDGRV